MKIPVTFAGGGAAVKTERPEAPAETPPGYCRCGADFQERLERLERLHRAELESALLSQKRPAQPEKMQAIVSIVAERTGVSVADIMGTRRHEHVASARMLAYYIQKQATRSFYLTVAEWWGRDRGTIKNGCKQIQNRLETVPEFRPFVDAILSEI